MDPKEFHWICLCGSEAHVRVAIEAGTDVNARDKSGRGAFDYALENERLKGTEILERLRRTEPPDFFELCKYGAAQHVRDVLAAGDAVAAAKDAVREKRYGYGGRKTHAYPSLSNRII